MTTMHHGGIQGLSQRSHGRDRSCELSNDTQGLRRMVPRRRQHRRGPAVELLGASSTAAPDPVAVDRDIPAALVCRGNRRCLSPFRYHGKYPWFPSFESMSSSTSRKGGLFLILAHSAGRYRDAGTVGTRSIRQCDRTGRQQDRPSNHETGQKRQNPRENRKPGLTQHNLLTPLRWVKRA